MSDLVEDSISNVKTEKLAKPSGIKAPSATHSSSSASRIGRPCCQSTPKAPLPTQEKCEYTSTMF